MYDFFSQISNLLTQPLVNIGLSTTGLPILSAFVLGIVGALAPCQFTGNLGAITVYGNQSIQQKIAWKSVLFFTFGKIAVFSSLGILVWLLGSEVKNSLISYFPWIRRIVGPMFIFIGLFMIGIIKFHKSFSFGSIQERLQQKGNLGAFFMGVSFTLGFCPTMFTLFFMTLIPMAASVSYGAVLPIIFAIGTSLPLIIAIFLIWYLDLGGSLIKKKGRKLGTVVQKLAGGLMIILGILDTITYWSF
ncbi:urease accessory protein UreH domain-containing protein [Cytobacillus dafuensis]|uniref:Sulfite exporter TauE/SafE family protein n=1 Tax=Cytobacillus dafuensis TaxID=1742359 RepID=A0A5B8Z8I7_CYTDA|nr:sulfite exporter TauE/SafE family protein [Cytobacillus dafuensis]QED49415.1 sulfite exporter TauE/SafE family protein [Cytobacillus dafuensis]